MAVRSNPRLVSTGTDAPDFELIAETTAIGSAAGNDFTIADPTVSRRHATIIHLDNSFRITDLGATNGTYVNGSRISAPVELKNGDELRFGAAVFRFAHPVRSPLGNARSRKTMVLLISGLVFAAGFAITIYLVNFDRLQGATETSTSVPPSPVDASSVASLNSVPTPVTGTAPDAVPSAAVSDSDANVPSPNTDDSWLRSLNGYRENAGLPPVTENNRFSRGDYLHSRYIVKNYGKQIAERANLGAEMHFEDPSKPWYTVEGKNAGLAGDVDQFWSPRGPSSPSWAIDNWMQSPFHRLPILNPHLHSVGYGSICEDAVCIASLNLNSDVDPMLSAPEKLSAPIEYPPNGASIELNSFDGEWPDPLTSCSGYSVPAGYPITLQLGSLVNSGISSYSLKQTAPTTAALEACAFDGNNYDNPDPGTQNMIRNQLTNFGAVVMIPRAPLAAGDYSVSITAGGHEYAWSFSVQR
jgi:hypothetical protein